MTLQHLTLNSPIVISKDFVVLAPEGSETATKAVMYGEFRLRQALELTPTDSFHLISSNCEKQIQSTVMGTQVAARGVNMYKKSHLQFWP